MLWRNRWVSIGLKWWYIIVIRHVFHLFQGSNQEDIETTLPLSAGREKGLTRSLPITDVAYLKSRRYYRAAAAHCWYYVRSKPPTIEDTIALTRSQQQSNEVLKIENEKFNEKGGVWIFIYARGIDLRLSVHSHFVSMWERAWWRSYPSKGMKDDTICCCWFQS